jgi:hypothetical protein
MFRPSVCRVVIGKDRTFCRFPRKNPYGARRNGLSSTAGPRVRISFPPAESPCKPDALDQVAENFAERLRVTGRTNRVI